MTHVFKVKVPSIEIFYESLEKWGVIDEFVKFDRIIENKSILPDFRNSPGSFLNIENDSNKEIVAAVPARWPAYPISEYCFYACICSKLKFSQLNWAQLIDAISNCSRLVGWQEFRMRNRGAINYTGDDKLIFIYPQFEDPAKFLVEMQLVLQSGKSASYNAFFIHLIWLCYHPLYDGNGRLARSLMNAVIFSSNPMSWIPFKMLFRPYLGEYLFKLREAAVNGKLEEFAVFFINSVSSLIKFPKSSLRNPAHM